MTVDDCYMCGDGVVDDGRGWRHSDDRAIDIDGQTVFNDCQWGKPFAPNPIHQHASST